MGALQTIGILVGLIASLWTLFHFLSPHIIRWSLKPRIEVKHTLGTTEDVTFRGSRLYTQRKVTLWVHNRSNRTLKLDTITFRRLCRFQDNCLLFRYLCRTRIISSNDWCPCSRVTDLALDSIDFAPVTNERKKELLATFADEGKLKLSPAHDRIPESVWRDFDVPLKLRVAKAHTIEVTFSFYTRIEDMPSFLRGLYTVVNPTREEIVSRHIVTRNLRIDLSGDKGSEAGTIKQMGWLGKGFKVVCQYFPDPTAIKARLASLQTELVGFLSKNHFVSEMRADEVRETLRKSFPEADIVYSLPPNGKYRFFANEEAMRGVMKVWAAFREFCKDFLDCEEYAFLFKVFLKKLMHPALPKLLECTCKYLVLASHNPLADWLLNLSQRTKPLPLALVSVSLSEVRTLVFELKMKSSLKRQVDHIAESIGQLAQAET